MAIHSEKSRKKPSYFDAPLKSTVQSMKRAFERSNTFLGIGQGSFYLSNWNLIPNRKVKFWHCIFCAQDNTQYVLILFNCSLFHKLFIALIKLKFFSLKKRKFLSHNKPFTSVSVSETNDVYACCRSEQTILTRALNSFSTHLLSVHHQRCNLLKVVPPC